MNVFQNETMGYAESPKSMSECKRNYEKEIAREKNMEQASIDVSNAILRYIGVFGKGDRQFTLASLYGSLLLEQRDLSEKIINLQEQWETEK